MSNIKPISDLRNDREVLPEKTQATFQLMNELTKGRKSGEEKGGLTLEAVEKELGIVNDGAFIRRSPKRSFSVREQSKNFF